MAGARDMTVWQANRHEPFGEGNEAARKHGARAAAWRLSERAAEIADGLRPGIPDYVPSDEVLLGLLATTLVRIELANRWLERQPSIVSTRGKPLQILADLSRWESNAARYATTLGLGQRSRRKGGSQASDALDAYLASKEEPE
jgi:hypothetical protein